MLMTLDMHYQDLFRPVNSCKIMMTGALKMLGFFFFLTKNYLITMLNPINHIIALIFLFSDIELYLNSLGEKKRFHYVRISFSLLLSANHCHHFQVCLYCYRFEGGMSI